MSGVQISGEPLEEAFDQQDELTDSLDEVLNDFPGPIDGGAAAREIAVLFQAAIEGMSNLADTHRALIAVARDVCQDLTLTDTQAADQLREIKQGFEDEG